MNRSRLILCAALSALATCGAPKRPTDDQTSRYIGGQLPSYLTIRSIDTDFEQASTGDGASLPAGSWRVVAKLKLRTEADLYAVTPEAEAIRQEFAAAVTKAEAFRLVRIQAVEGFAAKLGLMKDPRLGPMPALPVALTAHKGDDVPGQVTLLAEPVAEGWKFVPQGFPTLDMSRVGAPLDMLKASNPKLNLVLKGSDEALSFRARQADFLAQLKRLPPP